MKKHGIDRDGSVDFCQSHARGGKERSTDLARDSSAVDDLTAWLTFGETAQVE
jgi:hypothetical protein